MKDFAVVVKHPSISRVIQELFLRDGRTWCNGDTKVQNTNSPILVYREKDRGLMYSSSSNTDSYKDYLISIDEVLNLLIEPPIKIGEYIATITEDKDFVNIGCQSIPKTKVKEILDLMS